TRRGTRLAQLDFRHTGTWRAPRGPLGIKLTGKYQNLDLITRPNGTMYLLGTYRTGPGISGNDFAHLFRVTGTFAHPGLKLVAKRHLYCGTPEGQQCNFIAAGGAYVSPSGRLFLYGVEHDNDGPQGTVKAEEFRPVPHRSTCDIVNDAYVELYDDTDFDGDRSVMIDYNDQGRRNYDDYDQVERFEDKASAARWCLPPGVKYLLYADKAPCGGRVVTLTGNGEPAADHRFKGSGGAVHGFNDEVSCSRWVVPTPTPTPTPVPTPTPTGVPTPTPTATPLPDLVITAFDLTTFTVSNQGAGPAGAFAVTVQGAGDTEIAGLAAGASATRTYTQQPCESVHQATADSHGQVMETNEFNNVSQFTPIC
ncbi:MAG: hypothetical protein QOI80_357, partial [Solirubrobacteraceae bacterium]|nr:hypothetical protein [Solirubrobacteraceae bacterium]